MSSEKGYPLYHLSNSQLPQALTTSIEDGRIAGIVVCMITYRNRKINMPFASSRAKEYNEALCHQ